MADRYEIRRALQALGSLFASEHAEHDDAGASQIRKIMGRLQQFAKHEDAERQQQPTSLTEAAYDLPDGRKVWYDAGDALKDANDLYTVLSELHGTGSPNLENTQARELVNRLQMGSGLGEVHVGTLRKLLAKHHASIQTLRRSKARDGQNVLAIASDGPDARIIQPNERA